jgi:hypothetical protein
MNVSRWLWLTLVAGGLLGLFVDRVARAEGATPAPLWQERFDHEPLGWVDPSRHSARELARVYSVQKAGERFFLHARHDVTESDPPPAMHYGRTFQSNPAPLERVRSLQWKWRVLRHPAVTRDPWLDVAASVYVVIKVPTVLPGKGFKFAWLAKPGPSGTKQRGLLQVGLRADPAGREWRSESVDVCALYRRQYGPCEGQHVLYVGVVTDADGSKSLAEADYADFELLPVAGEGREP